MQILNANSRMLGTYLFIYNFEILFFLNFRKDEMSSQETFQELDLTTFEARAQQNVESGRVPPNLDNSPTIKNLDPEIVEAQARRNMSEMEPSDSIEKLWQLGSQSPKEQNDSQFFANMSGLEEEFDRVLSQTLTPSDPYPEQSSQDR